MWQTLQKSFPRDKDQPERTARIQALTRVLQGTIYNQLRYGFHQEITDAGEYIKLRDRRPSVRQNLCRLVVNQSVAMLFSDGHFPTIKIDDEETRETLATMVRDATINETMIDAATKGSVGSVCLWLRVLTGRIFVDAMTTEFLTPTWNPQIPNQLLSVRQRYKVKGKALAAQGYSIPKTESDAWYWWTRDWDATQEAWYQPVKVADDDPQAPTLKLDPQRSVQHQLGFVPLVWIKNLPGGDEIDGMPTFCDEAIETQIEMDYLLSQGSRGLKYSSDPLLMIKEPAADPGRQMIRSASNAIMVSADGDAKLLEIDGAATAAVLEYAKALRGAILEELSGNRADPDKLSAAQSGRALELLNQSMVWLCDKLRISYGENGLKALLRMILAISQKTQLIDPQGDAYPKLKQGRITLDWPDWYPPTAQDRSVDANTYRTLTDASLMSRETAVTGLAQTYEVEDVQAELARIQVETAERNANAQVQAKIME